VKDGAVTPDGYVVNTSFTVNAPHPPRCRSRTSSPIRRWRRSAIVSRQRRCSWAWYSGGWNDALAGHADPLFQYHHQPVRLLRQLRQRTAAKAQH